MTSIRSILSPIAALAAIAALALSGTDAFAQINTAAAAAAEAKVASTFAVYARLIQVAGFSLFLAAIMITGYKITYVPEGHPNSPTDGHLKLSHLS